MDQIIDPKVTPLAGTTELREADSLPKTLDELLAENPTFKAQYDAAMQREGDKRVTQAEKTLKEKQTAEKAKIEAAKTVAAIAGNDGEKPPAWAQAMIDDNAKTKDELANFKIEKEMVTKGVPLTALEFVKTYIARADGDVKAGVAAFLTDYPTPPKDLGPDTNLQNGKGKPAPLTPEEDAMRVKLKNPRTGNPYTTDEWREHCKPKK